MNITNVEANLRAIIKNGNIHTHIDLIAGLPYETLALFKESFNRAYALKAHDLQLGFLKLLHGSALRNQAKPLGLQYNDAPPYEIIQSPWLSPEDITLLKTIENPLRQTYNKGRFLTTLNYVLETANISPFDMFHVLGNNVQNHGLSLDTYAKEVYDCFCKLPQIDEKYLLESMIWDWLAMVRGKNMPAFLKIPDSRRKEIILSQEKKHGRGIGREEVALLPSSKWIYVDTQTRDPVTGLYKVQIV